jgi:hypothetical protein
MYANRTGRSSRSQPTRNPRVVPQPGWRHVSLADRELGPALDDDTDAAIKALSITRDLTCVLGDLLPAHADDVSAKV